MVQPLENYSMNERLVMVLHGASFAMYSANKDKEFYQLYKEGKTDDFSEERMIWMKILDVLIRLGFSEDELGTYLYKEVIAEAYEQIKDLSTRKDMEKCRSIMSELNDAFSSFYHYVAREYLEIGIKPFHLYIQKAIENVDETAVDIELSKRIFGESPDDNNYGLQAFQIAAFIAKKYSFEDVEGYKKAAVKKLSNMPNDIKLKYPF